MHILTLSRLLKRTAFAAGLSLAALASQAQIVLGQSIALTGGLSEHGKAVQRGAQLHFDLVNAAGGIGGQRVTIKTLDDEGKADKAAANVRNLIERDLVLAIFGGIEGGPCTSSLKVAVELKTPFIACMAGSPEMREPFDSHVFTVRAPHLAEFEHIIAMAASYGYTKFGFLHSDSDTGRKHLANVNRALAARKLAPARAFVLASGIKPDTLVKELLASDTQVVFNHGAYDFYGDMILQVRNTSSRNINFFAINSGIAQLARKLGPQGRGLTFTSVVPFPNSGREAIAREFRKAYATVFPNEIPSLSSMEGYISAKVMTEGLKRAGSGANLTRESLLVAMDRLGTVNLGNFLVHYAPGNHTGSTFVDTAVINADGRFVH
jgi:ABC-type branched-subunit amino acid transport system substrate-binding protein